MSPKIPPLAIGLIALGLSGPAPRGGAAPQDPAQAPAEALSPTVLLLTSGKVFQGEITEDDTGYVLRHGRVGVIHYDRRKVERVFRSMAEAYAYKKSQTPENDPDERMKLALWCLENKLNAEAKEQLDAVLALSPENRRAKAMLFSLNAQDRTAAGRDDQVVRSGGQVDDPPGAAPGELSLGTLRGAARSAAKAPAGLPVIFDLPPALAVKRYQEFANVVHVELQRRCARCHNDQSQSDFQLVPARAKRDFGNDLILRTNLDATLRLVNPQDLAHSPLLAAAGMTHPPDGRPVLGGPNHPSYRMLATWVNSLQAPTSGVTPAGYVPPSGTVAPPAPAGDGFAARRGAAPAAAGGAATPIPPGGDPPLPPIVAPGSTANPGAPTRVAPRAVSTPGQVVPGSADRSPTPDLPASAFPPPGMPGRMNPQPAPGKAAAPTPPADPNAKTIRLPDGTVAPVVTQEMLREGPSPKAKKKNPAINGDALQKFMSGRGGR